jgi:hypothetical protein
MYSQIRTTSETETEIAYSDSNDEEFSSTSPTNISEASQQSDTNIENSDLASAQITKVPKQRKYINRDIADDVLKMYQISVLPGEKLVFNGVNMLDSAYSNMRKMKKTEVAKSPLNINVISFHNLDCSNIYLTTTTITSQINFGTRIVRPSILLMEKKSTNSL